MTRSVAVPGLAVIAFIGAASAWGVYKSNAERIDSAEHANRESLALIPPETGSISNDVPQHDAQKKHDNTLHGPVLKEIVPPRETVKLPDTPAEKPVANAANRNTSSPTLSTQSDPEPPADSRGKIRVKRARVSTRVERDGSTGRLVSVDWTNVGDKPVTSVKAIISLYESDGTLVGRTRPQLIYDSRDTSVGILPGAGYTDLEGLVWFVDRGSKAEVEIVEVNTSQTK